MAGELKWIFMFLLIGSSIAIGMASFFNDMADQKGVTRLGNATALSQVDSLEDQSNQFQASIASSQVTNTPLDYGFIILSSSYAVLKLLMSYLFGGVGFFINAVVTILGLPSWVNTLLIVGATVSIAFAIVGALLRWEL
jgi:hypothetical protein